MEAAGEANDVSSFCVGASEANTGFDRFRTAAKELGAP
jgi:hypothetical protein